MKKNLKLEELEVYKVSMEIGELIWNIVMKWDYFEKKTLGVQLVRAADSIALNISEGYGRFYFKENKLFCYYSRGSAKETLSALTKAIFALLTIDYRLSTFLKPALWVRQNSKATGYPPGLLYRRWPLHNARYSLSMPS